MLYEKFVIENFKGIKSATIDLSSATGANVFTLVGLNESGKTTILEAIHSFSPDYRSSRITQSSGTDERELAQSRVPRHKIANFTGTTKVEATLIVSDDDRRAIVNFLKENYKIIVDPLSIPEKIAMSRADRFERGDYKDNANDFDFSLKVKLEKQRKAREASAEERKNSGILFLNSFRILPTIRPSYLLFLKEYT